MNLLPRQKLFTAAARWLSALLLALLLPANVFAQPQSPERWLFVFDLSPAMKKNLPATEAVVKNFLATGAEGRLQEGDNIGIWTYDQKMHAGQFPLATWDPKKTTGLTTNLINFLRSRKYTTDSRLTALQPALASVIGDSERLTIVIFSAGESELTGTPYDSGINQSFLDARAERKKSQQPFVVLIRTLSGKFIGCTVNFPPGTINIPLFLAPPPPTNTPPPGPAPVKPTRVTVPDLVISGTNVGAAATASPKPAPPAIKPAPTVPVNIVTPVTNTPPAPAVMPMPAPATNPAPAKEITLPKALATPSHAPAQANIAAASNAVTPAPAVATNPISTRPPETMAAPGTNPAPKPTTGTPPADNDGPTRRLIITGVSLLGLAILLVVVLVIRANRRPQSSLISSSMQDDPRRK